MGCLISRGCTAKIPARTDFRTSPDIFEHIAPPRMAPVADMDLQASLNFMGVAKMSATCDLQPIVTGQSAYVSLGQSIEQIGIEAAEKARYKIVHGFDSSEGMWYQRVFGLLSSS